MESLVPREQLLVALGAAIGSNCTPCVEKILPKAKAAGLEDWELRVAIHSADFVRKKPAAKVLEVARTLVEGDEETESKEPCPLERKAAPASRAGCCAK